MAASEGAFAFDTAGGVTGGAVFFIAFTGVVTTASVVMAVIGVVPVFAFAWSGI